MRAGAMGGIGLIVVAVFGFLLKHTEPPQWDWLLARIGIATAKSMAGGNTGSETTIKSGSGYRPLQDPCAYRDKFQDVSEKQRSDCGAGGADDLLKALRDRSGSGSLGSTE